VGGGVHAQGVVVLPVDGLNTDGQGAEVALLNEGSGQVLEHRVGLLRDRGFTGKPQHAMLQGFPHQNDLLREKANSVLTTSPPTNTNI